MAQIIRAVHDGERELLIGIIAARLGFVTSDALLTAGAAYAADRTTPIADRLALTDGQRRIVEAAVGEAIELNDGDVRQTLDRVGRNEPAYTSFGGGSAEPSTVELTSQRYELGEEVGRGGIGRVRLAVDQDLGRQVAVKDLIEAGEGSTSGSVHTQRFLREARITGQLQHPNIVPVHELGKRDDGTLFYTMKLVRGRTLAAALDEAKDLQERLQLLNHFEDLCNAMAYAHSRGVVHRDIKPENVMVGAFGETVALDWGLAKQVMQSELISVGSGEQADAAQTLDGDAIGTPAYMSPEQAEGRLELIDERSDVWGLGAVLFEILSGQPPFTGSNPYEVVGKAMSADRPHVSAVASEAPAELCAIVEKALSKDRAQRYASAAEVASEIEAYRSGGRVAAHEYGLSELAARVVRRYRAPLTVAAVAVAALVATGSYATYQVVAERDRAVRSEARRRQSQAEALAHAARADVETEDLLSARAGARVALEVGDSLLGRAVLSRVLEHPSRGSIALPDHAYAVAFVDEDRVVAGMRTDELCDVTLSTLQVRVRALAGPACQRIVPLGDGHTLSIDLNHRPTIHFDLRSGRWSKSPVPGRLLDRSSTHWLVQEPDVITLYAVTSGTAERVARFGATGRIDSPATPAALSGDGSRAAVINDGLDVHDTATGQLIAHHPGRFRLVTGGPGRTVHALTLDGRVVAASGGSLQVRGWVGAVGTQDHIVFRWHPGTQTLLTAPAYTGAPLRLWYADGRRIDVPGSEHSNIAALSPDGDTLVSGSTRLHVWDHRVLRRQRPAYPSQWVGTIAYDASGVLLSANSGDKQLMEWDPRTGHGPRVLGKEEHAPWGVAVSPDGQLVAPWTNRRTLQVRDRRTFFPVATIEADSAITAAAFVDDRSLVVVGRDAISLHELPSGRRRWTHRRPSGRGWVLSLDASKEEVPYPDNDVVVVRGSRDGAERLRHRAPGVVEHVVHYDIDHLVYTSNQDVYLLDRRTGRARAVLRLEGAINGIAASGEHGLIAAASKSSDAAVYDVSTGRRIDLPRNRLQANRVAFSRDATRIAISGDDGTIRVHDPRTGDPIWRTALLWDEGGVPLVYTSAGVTRLDGKPAAVEIDWRTAPRRVRSGDAGFGRTCLATADSVELAHAGRVVAVRPRRVLATAHGCAVQRADGAVVLLDDEGVVVTVTATATAIGLGRGGQLLTATSSRTTAVAEVGGQRVHGGRGRVEVRGPKRVLLTDVSEAEATIIEPGPAGTVVVGFADGVVGVWSMSDGQRLLHTRLFGAVRDVLLLDGEVHVATELGDHATLATRPLGLPYCDLLRLVWKEIRVTRRAGRVNLEAPPRDHPCWRP